MILTLQPEQVLKLTFLAVLVKLADRLVWFPKSQILMTVGTDAVRMLVPEWLVKSRGL